MNKNILAAVAVMVISVVLLVVSLIRPDPEIPPELTLTPSDPPVQPSGPGGFSDLSSGPSMPGAPGAPGNNFATSPGPTTPGASDPILIAPVATSPATATPAATTPPPPSTMAELMAHLEQQPTSDPSGSLDDLGALPGPSALPPAAQPAGQTGATGVTPPPTTAQATTPALVSAGVSTGVSAEPTTPSVQMYEVQAGDTLSSIAQRFYGSGAKYPLIERANPGLDSYSLRIGKKIRIPPAATEATASATSGDAAGAKYYTVQEGDSYYTIARDQLGAASRYKELQSLNGIPAERLKVGDRLRLPTAGPPALAVPPATAGAQQTSGSETVHVVAEGETLTRIATKYYGSGDNWQRIADANGVTDPSLVYVGQRLRIPEAGAPVAVTTAAPGGGKIHTVQPNESMWKIADKYYGRGDQWQVIADANPDVDPDNLLAGQKLTIPANP